MITIEQLKEKGASAAQIALFMQQYPTGIADDMLNVALICGPAWTARAFLTKDNLIRFANKATEELYKTESYRRNAIHEHCKYISVNMITEESTNRLKNRLDESFYNLEYAMAGWVDYYYKENGK